jgi:hypothetical protein
MIATGATTSQIAKIVTTVCNLKIAKGVWLVSLVAAATSAWGVRIYRNHTIASGATDA